MPRIPDNAIVVTATVTITYKLRRQIDRDNPKRPGITKTEGLHIPLAIGSQQTGDFLAAELAAKTALIVADVASWEKPPQATRR